MQEAARQREDLDGKREETGDSHTHTDTRGERRNERKREKLEKKNNAREIL